MVLCLVMHYTALYLPLPSAWHCLLNFWSHDTISVYDLLQYGGVPPGQATLVLRFIPHTE